MTQPMCDVHIRGGVVVDSRTLRLADVFIRDGLVDSVEPPEMMRPLEANWPAARSSAKTSTPSWSKKRLSS